jgi:hypothetical protein
VFISSRVLPVEGNFQQPSTRCTKLHAFGFWEKEDNNNAVHKVQSDEEHVKLPTNIVQPYR